MISPPFEDTSIFMAPTSFEKFLKVITNIKSGNSVRYNGLSTKLLKNIAGVPLIPILNLCIGSGIIVPLQFYRLYLKCSKKI